MKKAIAFLAGLCLALSLPAQDNYFNDLPTFQSPAAASVAKAEEISVNHSTGVPGISVPIYSIQVGSFTLPVALNYHAGGFKVAEEAGIYGLGWSNTADGMVTHVIRGKEDFNNNGGYFMRTPAEEPGQYDFPTLDFMNEILGSYDLDDPTEQQEVNLDAALTLNRDFTPDYFVFNAPGVSGKFYIDGNDQPYLIPKSDHRITFDLVQGTFVITRPDGVQYHFGLRNYQLQATSENVTYRSESYLTKIVTAEKQEITYDYQDYTYTPLEPAAERRLIENNVLISTTTITSGTPLGLLTRYPERINFPNGYLEFSKGSGTRTDLPGAVKITAIKLYNSNDQLIHEWALGYDYFKSMPLSNTRQTTRLKLLEVKQSDRTGGWLPPYTLEYHSLELPSKTLKAIDHWGYWNDNGATTLIPTYSPPNWHYEGADRSTNPAKVSACLIKKLTYPTGGVAEFEFEANTYEDEHYEAIAENEIISNVHAGGAGTQTVNYDFTIDQNQNGAFGLLLSKINPGNPDPAAGTVELYKIVNSSPSGGPISGLTQTGITNYIHLLAGDYRLVTTVDFNSKITGNLNYTSDGPLLKHSPAGGARIKTITVKDGSGNNPDVVRSFSYGLFAEPDRSSGKLIAPISYLYQSTRFQPLGSNCNYEQINQTILQSTGVADGHSVSYTEVTESRGLAATGGSTRYTFSFVANTGLGNYFYGTDYGYKRGLPLKVEQLDNQGHLVTSQTMTYSYPLEDSEYLEGMVLRKSQQSFDCFNPPVIIAISPKYKAHLYRMYSEWIRLEETVTRQYDSNGNAVTSTETYDYLPQSAGIRRHHFPVEVTTTASNGRTIQQKRVRPLDLFASNTNGSDEAVDGIFQLQEDHNIQTVLEEQVLINDGGGYKTVSGLLTTWTRLNLSGNWVARPHRVFVMELSNPSTTGLSSISGNTSFSKDPLYSPRATYLGYNERGNPIRVKTENGPDQSFLYRYDGYLPVASVNNANTKEIAYNSFETTETGDWTYDELNTTASSSAPMGVRVYTLDDPITSPSVFAGQYVLSFWADGATHALTGASLNIDQTREGPTQNGWHYEERLITLSQGGTVQLSGSGNIDELRLYPIDAQMATQTPVPLVGVTHSCGINNELGRFHYDELSRVRRADDHQGNIVALNTYEYGISTALNRVSTVVPLMATTNEATINGWPATLKNTARSYLDGLGRTVQEIQQSMSPGLDDVVVTAAYDAHGRTAKTWLPYVTVGNGDFRSNWQGEHTNFYNTADRVAHSVYPYAETTFDNSPLDRPEEQSAPGNAWRMGQGHTLRTAYRHNLTDEVRVWTVSGGNATSSGTYPENDLTVVEITDENGNIRVEYTDQEGRTVLVRSNLSSGYGLTDGFFLYYAYNGLNQLAYVIQPQGYADMVTAGNYDVNAEAPELVFAYTYDARGRVIIKKVPGASVESYVYDNLDRPILTQTGVQAIADEWSFVKFDALGRAVTTGLFDAGNQPDPSRAGLQAAADAFYAGSGVNFETETAFSPTTHHGYTQQAWPTTDLDVLTVNYYDHYDFDRNNVADVTLSAPSDPEYTATASVRTRRLATGQKVKVLDANNNWLSYHYFFDELGRTIQQGRDLYPSGSETTNTAYNHSGLPTHQEIDHTYNGGTIELEQRYTYDHANRPLATFVDVDNGGETQSVTKFYNDLGQLIETNLGKMQSTFPAGTNPDNMYLQSVDYFYNIRGWLTHINNCDLTNNRPPGWGDNELALNNGYTHVVDRLGMNLVIEEGTDTRIELAITDDKLGLESLEEYDPNTAYPSLARFTSRKVVVRLANDEALYNSLSAFADTPFQIDFNGLHDLDTLTDTIIMDHGDSLLRVALNGINLTGASDQDAVSDQLVSYIWESLLTPVYNDDDNDLWGFCLDYDDPENGQQGVAQFNGNISALRWKSQTDDVKKGYGFDYDGINRLLKGIYRAWNTTSQNWTDQTDRYSLKDLSYDTNGNIRSLKRYGLLDPVSANFGIMDQLAYTYSANRLTAVSDAIAGSHTNDFVDGVTQHTEYTYDNNGNLLSDANKDHTATYNHLNLPELVSFPNQGTNGKSLKYVYDATGTLLAKENHDNQFPGIGTLTTTTWYTGTMQYQDNALEFIAIENGRIIDDNGSYRFDYHISDHLGNLRLAFSDLDGNKTIDPATEILQESNYYPFGLKHSYANSSQPPAIGAQHDYQYNGKELQDEFGLGWYHYGARMYDPVLGRWAGVEPLAEKYLDLGTYNYVANRPTTAVDPDGRYILLKIKPGSIPGYYKSTLRLTESNISTYLGEGAATLMKTDLGKDLMTRFLNDPNNDVIMAFGKQPLTFGEGGGHSRATTLFDIPLGTQEMGRFFINKLPPIKYANEEDKFTTREFLKLFEGVAFRGEAETVSFMVFDNSVENKYEKALTLYHEFFAHILLALDKGAPVGGQHDAYGEEILGDTPTKGSPAEKIHKAIRQLRESEENGSSDSENSIKNQNEK